MLLTATLPIFIRHWLMCVMTYLCIIYRHIPRQRWHTWWSRTNVFFGRRQLEFCVTILQYVPIGSDWFIPHLVYFYCIFIWILSFSLKYNQVCVVMSCMFSYVHVCQQSANVWTWALENIFWFWKPFLILIDSNVSTVLCTVCMMMQCNSPVDPV